MTVREYPYTKAIVRKLFRIVDFILELFFQKKRDIPIELTNILLIKPDHLGDVVLFSSILKPLKEKYPSSNIDVVLGSWSNQILNNNPYIRTIYNIDHYKHNRGNISFIKKIFIFIQTYKDTLQGVRKVNYDITLNFRSYGANLVTLQYFSCSKCNIGFASSGFSPLLDIEVALKKNQHEIEYFFDILREVGVDNKKELLSSKVFISEDDKKLVTKVIKENNLEEFIIIHPGSGDINRMKDYLFWQFIVEKTEKKIVFCGTQNEKYLIKDIKSKNTIDLMGKFTVLQLVEFYKKASLIYTVESLAGHLASMTKTKTISFYSDFTDTIRWKPIGENVKVIKNHEKYLDEL